MTIIALVNQKGGTGKTCTALHLAYYLAVKKKKTILLIDTDAQRSATEWVSTLQCNLPSSLITDPNILADAIPELAEKQEYTIIDAAGNISETTRVILSYADKAIIPCQPTALDLQSSGNAINLIRQARRIRKGEPKAAVFINRAVPRTRLKAEALELLASLEDIKLLKSVIHQRQAIADSAGQEKVVWELGHSGKEAAREYDSLCKEVLSL